MGEGKQVGLAFGNYDDSTYFYYKDEPLEGSKLGVLENKIVEIPNFIDDSTAKSIVKYFEITPEDVWGYSAFYSSKGLRLPDDDKNLEEVGLYLGVFSDLRESFKKAVELVFGREVRPNTSHGQKWPTGAFAMPHSDNSDMDGNPSSFEINKYVGILYLSDDYDGGHLYFPEHEIDFRPNYLSLYVFPGGHENIHGVSEVTRGERYTMVSFWDFADAEYSDERKEEWAQEKLRVEQEQAEQRERWASGNKDT